MHTHINIVAQLPGALYLRVSMNVFQLAKFLSKVENQMGVFHKNTSDLKDMRCGPSKNISLKMFDLASHFFFFFFIVQAEPDLFSSFALTFRRAASAKE